MAQTLAYSFIALIVIIDPVGVAAAFVALTPGLTDADRQRIALRAVAIAGATLLVFAFAGDLLLKALGIGVPAFQIAGGALLFLIAIDMVLAHKIGVQTLTSGESTEADLRADVSVFPLAIPLLAGPGALTTMVLLMGKAGGDPAAQAGLILVLIAVLAITLALLLVAGRLARVLGVTGTNVIARVLGILLAALAVQLILDGLRAGLLAK